MMDRDGEEAEVLADWIDVVDVDGLSGAGGAKWDVWQRRLWPMSDLAEGSEER